MKRNKNAVLTLITNLDFIQFQAKTFRVNCNALLVEQNMDQDFSFAERDRIRGFGISASWAAFTYWPGASAFPIKLRSAQDNSMLILGDEPPKPIFSGSILTMNDGEEFFLQVMNQRLPLQVETFLGAAAGDDLYPMVWDVLEQRTMSFQWTPYVPYLTHVPNPNRVTT